MGGNRSGLREHAGGRGVEAQGRARRVPAMQGGPVAKQLCGDKKSAWTQVERLSWKSGHKSQGGGTELRIYLGRSSRTTRHALHTEKCQNFPQHVSEASRARKEGSEAWEGRYKRLWGGGATLSSWQLNPLHAGIPFLWPLSDTVPKGRKGHRCSAHSPWASFPNLSENSISLV